MKMTYVNADGVKIAYKLKTDPKDAMYWTTRKIKMGEIQVLDGTSDDKKEAKRAIHAELEEEYKHFKTLLCQK